MKKLPTHVFESEKGQIGGSHCDNFLRFKFQVDQTILMILKEALLDYSEVSYFLEKDV